MMIIWVPFWVLNLPASGRMKWKRRMPVDNRTKQPFGILHGGASVVLAETVGSFASHFVIDQ